MSDDAIERLKARLAAAAETRGPVPPLDLSWLDDWRAAQPENVDFGVPDVDVPEPAPKRRRKPSIRTMILQAEKAGKSVASITTPDGTTLTFGTAEQKSPEDPWERAMQGPKQ